MPWPVPLKSDQNGIEIRVKVIAKAGNQNVLKSDQNGIEILRPSFAEKQILVPLKSDQNGIEMINRAKRELMWI